MFYLFFYLLVSYAIVGALLFTVKAIQELFPPSPQHPQRERRQRSVFKALVIIGLLLPFTPYAVVKAQTLLYGAEMETLVRRALTEQDISSPKDPILILRVLKMSPSFAEVYFVQPCEPMGGGTRTDEARGFVVRFENTPTGWQYQDEECVWSDGGSADGNTFPPYLEAKEF